MKERIKSIDSLRGLAILAVLFVHTTTRTLEASKFDISGFSWTLFLNQIARFAVPLFFVISGFVLEFSAKEETYWSFIKRRFSKIFIPYVVWSAIYYLFVYNNNHDNFFRVILTGDASYQLYFIPTLCIFYLIFPILHKFYKFVLNPLTITIFGGLEVYLLYTDYFVKQFNFSDPVHIAILAYFYFLVGIVAAKNKEKIDYFVCKWKRLIIPSTLISGFYVFWEGRERYLSTGNYLSYYSQWRPSVFIYSILIGLTFYYLYENTLFRNSIICRFSKYSFFAFFIHVAILELFWKYLGLSLFSITNSFVGKIVFDPIFFVGVAIFSFMIARYSHKIPKLKNWLG